jgi:acetyl-CoA hydrolase/transferase-like protein
MSVIHDEARRHGPTPATRFAAVPGRPKLPQKQWNSAIGVDQPYPQPNLLHCSRKDTIIHGRPTEPMVEYMGSYHGTGYDSKLVSLEQALAMIRPGSRIYLGTGCAAPRTLLAGLEEMEPSPPDLEFVSFVTTSALPMKTGASHRHRTFFVGSDVQSLAKTGQLDYVPISLEEVPSLLASGRLPIDAALLEVSPPDSRGYVSLGVSVDLAPAVLSVARKVIAEVNPAMPRTHGESFVHLGRFDALVMVDTPVAEYRHADVGDVGERVARYIASIIDDGSTLQIGLGRVPNEALRHLRDHRDLGIHSDVITDGLIDLIDAGVVTGRRKTRHQGRVVASYCLGTRRLYDYVDDNPNFLFLPIDQVCDPEEVAANPRMVSLTQAFAIDLTGQVCVDQFEGQFYGGVSTQTAPPGSNLSSKPAMEWGSRGPTCITSSPNTASHTCSASRSANVRWRLSRWRIRAGARSFCSKPSNWATCRPSNSLPPMPHTPSGRSAQWS